MNLAKTPIRKFPIGIQDFVSLREDGFLYVDKTDLVHKLANEGRVYFLSRPRRFGKSLMLSTLGAYFEGRKDLFHGLAIEQLEHEWKHYPVLRLDLNAEDYSTIDGLHSILNRHLEKWERTYPGGNPTRSLAERFFDVIDRASTQTGQRVVVLVDEYDKPLLSTIGNQPLMEAMKGVLKPFYGVLKSADAHLRFALLTGVTKFGQVSVFSDLNQLKDITLDARYATICGITEEELLRDFQPELSQLADQLQINSQECIQKVRKRYNGYLFHPNGPSVYNPFSTLQLLDALEFRDYWFATGTPTFLRDLLLQSDYDLRDLDGVQLKASAFSDYKADPDRPLPVIFQSGYLTIQSFDPQRSTYTLGFPNEEVKSGFLDFLLPSYSPIHPDKGGVSVAHFADELEAGDVEALMTRLQAFFAGIPYDLNDQTERHYQVIFYLIFALVGQYIRAEEKSAQGRADAVVWTHERIYVFEFKLNGTAEEALAQINSQGYSIPWQADERTVVKIGVEFSKETRNISRWLVE
jgi:hypothetical protein